MPTSIETAAARDRLAAAGLGPVDLAWFDQHDWNDADIPPPEPNEIAAYERREAALNSAIAGLGITERGGRWKAGSRPPSGRGSSISATETRTPSKSRRSKTVFPTSAGAVSTASGRRRLIGCSSLLSVSGMTGSASCQRCNREFWSVLTVTPCLCGALARCSPCSQIHGRSDIIHSGGPAYDSHSRNWREPGHRTGGVPHCRRKRTFCARHVARWPAAEGYWRDLRGVPGRCSERG